VGKANTYGAWGSLRAKKTTNHIKIKEQMTDEQINSTEQVVDIDSLQQDTHNFNRGTEQGQQLMEKSFSELGAGRSILVDKNGNIIAGNKSQKAAKAAGIKKVRIIETTGDELVAVKRTDIDIDSAEGRKMALLDNLTTQVNLAWDPSEINAVSSEIEGFDPSDYGFDPSQYATGPAADPNEADKVKEDDFDPDAEHYEPVTRQGDIWLLGNHRLMCGDSTKTEDVVRLMQGEKADLWLTDPPYNVDYSSKNAMLNKQDGGNRIEVDIENDKMSDSQFHEFLHNAFSSAMSVMREGCPFYVWTAQGHAMTDIMRALDGVGLPFSQQLIWKKNNFVLGRMDYQWIHEPCLYGWKEGAAHYFIGVRNRTTVYQDGEEIDIDKMKKSEMQKLLHDILDNPTPTTVIDCPKPQKSADHPTMKPVRLFGYQIANSSRPGNIILDTFGGSGTTIVACEQLGRKARLMELDPHYCDVIIARWEKLTGQKAIKLNP
jgi:DNA modification methylase